MKRVTLPFPAKAEEAGGVRGSRRSCCNSSACSCLCSKPLLLPVASESFQKGRRLSDWTSPQAAFRENAEENRIRFAKCRELQLRTSLFVLVILQPTNCMRPPQCSAGKLSAERQERLWQKVIFLHCCLEEKFVKCSKRRRATSWPLHPVLPRDVFKHL